MARGKNGSRTKKWTGWSVPSGGRVVTFGIKAQKKSERNGVTEGKKEAFLEKRGGKAFESGGEAIRKGGEIWTFNGEKQSNLARMEGKTKSPADKRDKGSHWLGKKKRREGAPTAGEGGE